MSSRPDVKPTTISYNDADSKNWQNSVSEDNTLNNFTNYNQLPISFGIVLGIRIICNTSNNFTKLTSSFFLGG